MRKPIQLKRMVPLLLPVVLIIGVLFFYYQGKALKASAPDPLVSVTVDKKAVEKDSLETDKETVELTLKAKDTDVFEIPYDDTVSVVPLNEEGQEIAYPQLDSSDFKKSDALKLFEDRVKTVQSSSNSSEKDEQEASQESSIKEENKRLPYYQVRKEEGKGSFYFELEKDQEQRVCLTRLTKKEKSVDLKSLKDTNRTQPIVVFQSTEQLTKAPEEMPAISEVESEDGQPETKQEPISEETTKKEEQSKVTNEKTETDPQTISLTDPFKVGVDVGKFTGTAPFDTKTAPGYDKSINDDYVRTFDQITYEVTMGISNFDNKYLSLRVRLDMELPDAWRKDSSGQVRQTAEFAYGTLVDTGSGTKKSVRTTYATAEKATAEAFFTETVEVYGGVNGEEIKPNFKLTIEKATLSNGDTVDINQEIDGTVAPVLKEKTKALVSAKPHVDVKLAWSRDKISTFEKVTQTKDKPNTLVTNVAAYAQLKPLPGRSDLTLIKGSTYPVGGIEYEIDQKQLYNANKTTSELGIGTDTDPVQVIAYDGLPGTDMGAAKVLTPEYSKYSANFNFVSRQGIQAPVGYTRKIYPPNQAHNALIGIYDTGNPKVENVTTKNSIKISNNDYKPVSVGKNKSFLSGTPMGSNAEPFSVTAMHVSLPTDYLESKAGTGAASVSMDYVLSVKEIKYEGQSQEISSDLKLSWNKEWPGSIKAFSAFQDKNGAGLSSAPVENQVRHYSSNGDGTTAKGNKLFASIYASVTDGSADTGVLYGRWNSNSFEYDFSRSVNNWVGGIKIKKNYYGVGSASPDKDIRTDAEIESEYAWYETPEEAKNNGKISAIKTEFNIIDAAGYILPRIFVPLKAVGIVGATDVSGAPNSLLTNIFVYSGGKLSKYAPNYHADLSYKPTKYSSDGELISSQTPKRNWADTLYIAPLTIRPTIFTDKKTYAPDEPVKWTVDGKVESGSEKNHKVQFEVTIPKATQYTQGTAKDYKGEPLPDPSSMVENKDGTWTLKWILDYMAEGSTYNPSITFSTSIISSKLDFMSNVAQLNGKVVSDVWLEDDESVRDNSSETFRTSTTGVTVTNSGVIVVDKVVDKPQIESGNEIDPAKPTDSHPTDFTYTVSFKNHSALPMDNVKVLDVLPYNGDARGTDFNGSYSLTEVKQLPGGVQGTIWYTNNPVLPNTDPNSIMLTSGWYKLGSDMSELKNAKAIMAVYDELDQGKDMSISLTLRPTGQKAGDKYVNAPSMNSHLNKFVQGVPSGVRVYGRDLSGVAWYDDNLDGLIGNKPAGGAEEWAKDIPVKLYRTSIEVPTYKKELVKESLTGEKFIDASGNSLKKTDANGKYLFENLPEGEYVAEFTIGDKVIQREVRVTKQLEGSDPTKNSKADKESYQTPEYKQPILSEVAGLGATDSKNHVTDVNLGLIRPSTIRLFKYATGTAIDANQDGKLSEAEKATGTPLKDAEFEVYEGDAKTPFATETTDSSGYLNFVKLFPGEHTLIETKAPSGYELIKSPIKVTITEGNQTIKVYQEDDKKADLPFTGGNGPMFAILLAASGALILGFGYMLWYYRMPKRKGGR
ncbi:SpaA isopeptide-forming pilin-related protein [Enterococcus sp. AZ196]|uniref:SpaA isopeptide-forming pilin-related protein n=1 Tax=Enterococcus sp. AZ196 TaxID=2774659 RepID=UPI003D28B5C0